MLKRVIVCLVIVGCAGCAPSEDDAPIVESTERGRFRLSVSMDGGALRRGSNRLTVRAWDTSGAAVLTRVVAVMPAHAHEASEASARAAGDGWRVDDLQLSMAGRWVVTLRFERGATRDEARIDAWVP